MKIEYRGLLALLSLIVGVMAGGLAYFTATTTPWPVPFLACVFGWIVCRNTYREMTRPDESPANTTARAGGRGR